MNKPDRKLVIGIGNEGRGDDGLGWRFAEAAETVLKERIDVAFRFQLQVEDAELVSKYDAVIFADACTDFFEKGFDFASCHPGSNPTFSSHILAPETVLSLSQTLYGQVPKAFVMKICGLEFGLAEGLSPMAQCHLNAAVQFFTQEAPSL